MSEQDNSAAGQAERRAAARILGAVLVDRVQLGRAVAEHGTALSGPERARTGRAVAGTLRRLGAIDALLDGFLKKDTPIRVRHVLRLATWEMHVDGVPTHAAVDGAVRSVKATRKIEQLAGLTNAVARKIAAATLSDAPARLPTYLRKPLVSAYSGKIVTDMEALFALTPPLDLTARDPGQISAIAAAVGGRVLPTGSIRLDSPGQVTALPGYDTGDWWVQDAAAALPVRMLGDVRGLRVLDLCAAPGGKTMQLAAAGAEVTALDSAAPRLERLRDNLARTQLAARVVCEDVRAFRDEPFDAVVLDAPCSATGTLRRHPDLPYIKRELDLEPLLRVQAAMVLAAAKLVRPGGKLLYCTCSLLPSEGGAQVYPLVGEGWTVCGTLPEGADADWLSKEGHLRLRPDYWAEQGGMDGFFATVLQKPA